MENNSSHKFSHGFVAGAIIGAAAYFFLGTKKGRKLLKFATEDGIDMISEWGETVTEQDSIEKLHNLENTSVVQKGERFVKDALASVSSDKASKK